MVAKKKVEAKAPVSAAPKPEPHESYRVIKRGDFYVVEVTLYGRVLHDERAYSTEADAAKAMAELSKHLK